MTTAPFPTDAELRAMPIAARNALLDDWMTGADDERACRAAYEAELANERYFEERGGGQYVGSREEAMDRYRDWMHG